MSCWTSDRVLCSGRTIQRRVCVAYTWHASWMVEISDMPLRKRSRSPRSSSG